MNYDYILLAGRYLGGAEIFALQKLLSGQWRGQLIVNPALAQCLEADSSYATVRRTVLEELEPLSERVSWSTIGTAARAIDCKLGPASVLLANMRVAASQLRASKHRQRDSFVHDNCTYLNLKARTLVALICLRSARTFFACAHARDAVMPVARAWGNLAVQFYASYRPFTFSPPRQHGELLIVTIGRIEPAKGQLYAVQVAAKLRSTHQRVRLSLLGAVHDPVYDGQVRASAARAGVELEHYVLGHADVGSDIARHDLVLHTSHVESLPLVLFEANQTGTPFFALPAGGIAEVLPSRFLLTGDASKDAAAVVAYFSPAGPTAGAA